MIAEENSEKEGAQEPKAKPPGAGEGGTALPGQRSGASPGAGGLQGQLMSLFSGKKSIGKGTDSEGESRARQGPAANGSK